MEDKTSHQLIDSTSIYSEVKLNTTEYAFDEIYNGLVGNFELYIFVFQIASVMNQIENEV